MSRTADKRIHDAQLLRGLSFALTYPAGGIGETLHELKKAANGDGCMLTPRQAQRLNGLFAAGESFEGDEDACLAYTRLFIGSLEMQAPPYASYYFSEDRVLGGRIAAEIESVYAQFGLSLGSDQIAPPDHLRYLLMFLSLLSGRLKETGNPIFEEAYTDFRDAYISPWFDGFEMLVGKHAESPYYPLLVSIIGETL